MKKVVRLLSIVLCVVLVMSLGTEAFAADQVHPISVIVEQENGTQTEIHAVYGSYEGNVYLSLRDLSGALSGSKKQYSFSYQYSDRDGEYFNIVTGNRSDGSRGDYTGVIWLDSYRNRIVVDGKEKRYYTYRYGRDLYMNLADILLMLDVNAEYIEENVIHFYTNEGLSVDLNRLNDEGYFDFFTGILVGDATTGEPLFYNNRLSKTCIASTTKLMTYLIIMEAVDEGKITLDDIVTIPQTAAAMSTEQDGTIEMHTGQEVPIMELIDALLIASSNESAVALATHVEGSEELFVAKMNQRAAELGLNSAEFYNSNGLPVFSRTSINMKKQNRMTAWDMFRLSSYILEHYPQITDITGLQYCTMSTLEYTSANSNNLVFNMPEVNGLKTGSTNKAGLCLVASMPLTYQGETHNIVCVVFGAETAALRVQAAELLMHAAKDYYLENGFSS